MNQTEIFRQQQRLVNGVRTPHLSKIPEDLQCLYIAIGKSSFVREFRSSTHRNKTLIYIWLREEEKYNLVVNARLKELFKAFPKADFPADFKGPFIRIKLPN